jgi:hypothetical protein
MHTEHVYIVGDIVKIKTPEHIGQVVKITRNGYYTVKLESGKEVKTRGRGSLELHSKSKSCATTVAKSGECTPDTASVYDPYCKKSGLTRSQAASYRRNQLVRMLCLASAAHVKPGLPLVTPSDMRLVVANGDTSRLYYQTMGRDLGDQRVELPAKELEATLAGSEHFKKAWAYVNHKDSARVRDIDQNQPHVIYMAVIHDQAYIGLAKRGVLHRWAGYRFNHMRAANSVETALSKTMLVDACMRKQCADGGKVWLFVVQHNPDLPLRAEETRLIHYFGTHGPDGMNATT